MLEIKDYIKCYENSVPDDLCQELINDKYLKDKLQQAVVVTKENEHAISDHRKCHDYYMHQQDTYCNKYKSKIHKIINDILIKYSSEFSMFGFGLSVEDTGYTFLLYKGSEKGEYKEHVDHLDLYPRLISISLILNDDYNGGDFCFCNKNIIIKKKKGSAIVFPSNFCFPHAVSPVSNGDRYSIVTWVH